MRGEVVVGGWLMEPVTPVVPVVPAVLAIQGVPDGQGRWRENRRKSFSFGAKDRKAPTSKVSERNVRNNLSGSHHVARS